MGCVSVCGGLLTCVCDRETVGGLQVIYIVIQMEGFLSHVLVGVVELNGESESAVFLNSGAHEESTFMKNKQH